MRKLLTGMCLVSAFMLIADVASARPRISLGSSKPTVAKSATARPDAAPIKATTPVKAQERPQQVTPRGWVVAVPRSRQQPAQAQSALDENQTPPSGALATSAGANDIGAAPSSPAPAKAVPEPQVAAKSSPEPQAAPKPADAAPASAPVRKRIAAAPHQPRDYAICYWNRTGQCVP